METVFIFAFIFVAVITIAFVRLVQVWHLWIYMTQKLVEGTGISCKEKNSLGKFSNVFISYSS